MTEKIIQKQIRSLFQNYEYKLFNTFMFAWESDFFAISKSGYSVEVEVKISRGDFRKDFTNKLNKHLLLKNHKTPVIIESRYPFEPYIHYKDRENGLVYDPDTWDYRDGDHSYLFFCSPAERLPNKFYYAVPENLVTIDEIPKYAGLIYIKTTITRHWDSLHETYTDKPDYTYYVAKHAPFLHKNVKDHKADLLAKYYFKHYDILADVSNFLHSIDDKLTDCQRQQANIIRHKFL